jgi:hypothetical protein
MSFADVVSARHLRLRPRGIPDMNTVYRTYFPTDPPARATVKALMTTND